MYEDEKANRTLFVSHKLLPILLKFDENLYKCDECNNFRMIYSRGLANFGTWY